MTAKHKMLTTSSEKTPKIFVCVCGKEYKQAPSLTRHKKKCNYVNNYESDGGSDDEPVIATAQMVDISSQSNILLELIRENKEFKQLVVDQNKQIQEHQAQNTELQSHMVEMFKEGKTINNTINNNQRFNLNFFLNDTCKDAMNITDFLGNMDVNVDELEYIGHHGYVNGMTKMIMDRLKDMDITKRPIHCTDVKRETMYIKDKDEWCKDTDELTKLRRILSSISMTNYRSVTNWRTAHPKSEIMDSREHNFCYRMMRAILGDAEDEQIRLDNKIIKTFAKDLFVNKNIK
uniref:C2H2-type domain-containing protein n=1 Tax=viral metagenome TaxID=1070528 RepID=A0A6C0J3L6_9ZZZZ